MRISPLCLGILGTTVVALGFIFADAAGAQDPAAENGSAAYGPTQAALDAYQLAEQQRREAIDFQVQSIERMASIYARPAYYPPYAIGVASVYGPPRVYRRGIVAAYASAYVAPRYVYPGYVAPWGSIPRSLYGYPLVQRVPVPSAAQVAGARPSTSAYGSAGDRSTPSAVPSLGRPGPATAQEALTPTPDAAPMEAIPTPAPLEKPLTEGIPILGGVINRPSRQVSETRIEPLPSATGSSPSDGPREF